MRTRIFFIVCLGVCLLAATADASPLFRVIEQEYEVSGAVQLIAGPDAPPTSYYDDYSYASTDSADGHAYVLGEGFEYALANSVADLGYASAYADTSNEGLYAPAAQAYATSRVVFRPYYRDSDFSYAPLAFDWDGQGSEASGHLMLTDLSTGEILFEVFESSMNAEEYFFDHEWDSHVEYELLIDLYASANTDGTHFLNVSTDMFELVIPEPASLALLGTGLIGLALVRRRIR